MSNTKILSEQERNELFTKVEFFAREYASCVLTNLPAMTNMQEFKDFCIFLDESGISKQDSFVDMSISLYKAPKHHLFNLDHIRKTHSSECKQEAKGKIKPLEKTIPYSDTETLSEYNDLAKKIKKHHPFKVFKALIQECPGVDIHIAENETEEIAKIEAQGKIHEHQHNADQ